MSYLYNLTPGNEIFLTKRELKENFDFDLEEEFNQTNETLTKFGFPLTDQFIISVVEYTLQPTIKKVYLDFKFDFFTYSVDDDYHCADLSYDYIYNHCIIKLKK